MTSETLDQLLATIRECHRCELPHGCHPILSAHAGQQVMLIGQAPGRREPGENRPFAGPAGRRIMGWFRRIGWSEAHVRDRIHLTAVTKCFPGPSPSGKGDRRPSASEVATCEPFLVQELALVRPRVLILVGQLAISRFLPGQPLDALVGREFLHQADWGLCWLIPLPHPSGASLWLNQPAHQRLVDQALSLLATRIGRGDLG